MPVLGPWHAINATCHGVPVLGPWHAINATCHGVPVLGPWHAINATCHGVHCLKSSPPAHLFLQCRVLVCQQCGVISTSLFAHRLGEGLQYLIVITVSAEKVLLPGNSDCSLYLNYSAAETRCTDEFPS